MWAQLITTSLKPGCEGDLPRLGAALRDAEQVDSGLVRSLLMQDQQDPSKVHMLVVFRSEEHARARESDPRREEGLARARAIMGEIFAEPPSFTDLTVSMEYVP